LRLVQDGHQIPFLFDQTGVCRELLPEVTILEPEEDTQTSLWALDLGHAHLPVSHLVCSTSEAMFRRSATLHEEVEDRRGRKQQRRIGSATWIRTPEEIRRKLVISATRRPLTRTLLLEVTNADNPPLFLEGFSVYCRTSRLIFKADGGGETWLYYGNLDAPGPQYDIALIAPALLAADKVLATLEDGESLAVSSWWTIGSPTGVVRWLFWLCLGVAVLVLLVVIAKLLPAASSSPDGTLK